LWSAEISRSIQRIEVSWPGKFLMNSGRGMPPLLTTRSWILRSCWRMLSTSERTLSHSFSTMRAEKRICISSAEIFFWWSSAFGALWPSFCTTDRCFV
jgi:hypothetical protein